MTVEPGQGLAAARLADEADDLAGADLRLTPSSPVDVPSGVTNETARSCDRRAAAAVTIAAAGRAGRRAGRPPG